MSSGKHGADNGGTCKGSEKCLFIGWQEFWLIESIKSNHNTELVSSFCLGGGKVESTDDQWLKEQSKWEWLEWLEIEG